jgi:hypothetical protein
MLHDWRMESAQRYHVSPIPAAAAIAASLVAAVDDAPRLRGSRHRTIVGEDGPTA